MPTELAEKPTKPRGVWDSLSWSLRYGAVASEGNLLEPLIMGRALRLHPAVVLVAVTAGALTAGVAGALVAVPVTAVTYRVWRSWSDNAP